MYVASDLSRKKNPTNPVLFRHFRTYKPSKRALCSSYSLRFIYDYFFGFVCHRTRPQLALRDGWRRIRFRRSTSKRFFWFFVSFSCRLGFLFVSFLFFLFSSCPLRPVISLDFFLGSARAPPFRGFLLWPLPFSVPIFFSSTHLHFLRTGSNRFPSIRYFFFSHFSPLWSRWLCAFINAI